MDQLDVREGPRSPVRALAQVPCRYPGYCCGVRRSGHRGSLEDCIRRGAKGLLKEVTLFDIYRGKGVAEGKKSVASTWSSGPTTAADRRRGGRRCESDFGNSGKGAGCGTALRTPRGRRGAQRVQASLRPAKSFDGAKLSFAPAFYARCNHKTVRSQRRH